MSTDAPLLSVVMPARNAAAFIDDAIASILDQTFGEFEFIICDDNSTDDTAERIAHWAARDDRIRSYWSDQYNSPARAANWSMALARGEFVARMDADDTCDPARLEKQLAVLRDDPSVALIGCLATGMDARSRPVYTRDRSALLSHKPAVPGGHATTMMRRAVFEQIGGYREQCDYWEDFDLIYRMGAIGRVVYLPDALYHYRHWTGHARVKAAQLRIENALDLRYRCGARLAAENEYESVLAEVRSDSDQRVHIRVFSALAGLHVNAGKRPNLLMAALQRGRATTIKETLMVYGMIVLGMVMPKALRSWQARMRRQADAEAATKVSDGVPVEWYWSAKRNRSG